MARSTIVSLLLGAWLPWTEAYMAANKGIPDDLPYEKFQHFVTRPDILVPKWEIVTYNKSALAPGYWFTAPYEDLIGADTGKPYIGPQIYDDDGELIWSSGDMFHNADAFDFRMSKYRGEDVMTLQSWHGIPKYSILFNNRFEIVHEENMAKSNEPANVHEFNLGANGTRALFLHRTLELATKAESKPIGYNGECHLESATVEVRDTSNDKDWKTIFHWDPRDYLSISDSAMVGFGDINKICSKKRWDWIHANGIDICPDGNYLFSARNLHAVYKLSSEDGHIMWQLGGTRGPKKSDIAMDYEFSKQHHPRCLSANGTHTTISMLDNANGYGPEERSNPWSRGLLLSVDEVQKTSYIINEYPHPLERIQTARGSMHVQENGNVFMGWSTRSLVSEHSPDGTVLQYARILPTWMRTYRSYKYPFVGNPVTQPDVVSQANSTSTAGSDKRTGVSTTVYVSWNGATEVRSWNLYRSDKSGHTTEFLTEATREGFETEIKVDGFVSFVMIEALDEHGNALPFGKTRPIKTRLPEGVSLGMLMGNATKSSNGALPSGHTTTLNMVGQISSSSSVAAQSSPMKVIHTTFIPTSTRAINKPTKSPHSHNFHPLPSQSTNDEKVESPTSDQVDDTVDDDNEPSWSAALETLYEGSWIILIAGIFGITGLGIGILVGSKIVPKKLSWLQRAQREPTESAGLLSDEESQQDVIYSAKGDYE